MTSLDHDLSRQNGHSLTVPSLLVGAVVVGACALGWVRRKCTDGQSKAGGLSDASCAGAASDSLDNEMGNNSLVTKSWAIHNLRARTAGERDVYSRV